MSTLSNEERDLVILLLEESDDCGADYADTPVKNLLSRLQCERDFHRDQTEEDAHWARIAEDAFNDSRGRDE